METLFSNIVISKTCSFCNKNCKSKRGCLITQIQNYINLERVGTKYKPISYMAVSMKLKHLNEQDIEYSLSICRDSKNRCGSFSKCFYGSLKTK